MKQEIKERVERIRKGEVPEGYQKTTVGIIPEDYFVEHVNYFLLDKKGAIKIGPFGSQLKKEKFVKNGIKVYGQENIFLNDFNFGDRHITDVHFQRLKSCELHSGDFVISTMGTIGKCAIMPQNMEKGIMDSHMIRMQLNDSKIIPEYLKQYFFFNSTQRQIVKLSVGGIMDGLSMSIVRSIKFIIPSIKEQEKIAEILSTWDKAIELKEELIEEKKEFKRGLMQKLLTGEMRFPEFTDEWERVAIGDVFEEVKRINGNNSKDIDILTISAKYGFLSQKEKFSKVIAGSSLKKYTHLFQNEFAYNKGNSKTAPFGCIFKLDVEEGLVPFVYICFRPTQMIDVDFFDFYFKHGLLDCQLKRIITSGARSDGLLNVSKDNFFNIKISLPSIEEQKKAGLVLRLVDNEIGFLNKELNQLKEQKRGLMQLLITGIVRVGVN
ncbi:MAG: restriction endonuclease subunit S [Methanosarcinales archaeon]|nr:restriction endonuclease subunit S [Methanosarcinales archaeon]